MAADTELYDQFSRILELTALDTATLKASLISSTYTRLDADTSWTDDVEADEVSGTGYTAGGVALTGLSVTNTKIDFDDIAWLTLTLSARRLVVYVDATVDSIAKPVLFSMLLDNSPADLTFSSEGLTVTVPAGGAITKTQAVV